MTSAPGQDYQILIIDDHALIRRGMSALIALTEGLAICGEAETMKQGLQQIRDLKPDLVVVDLTLPEGSGMEVIKHINATRPHLKILVCTMHDEKIYAERCLKAGAHGFINKEAASDQVVLAIQTILSGQPYLSEELKNRLLNRMVRGQQPNQTPLDSLTDRELEVLELLGQGLGTREIGTKLHLSHKTIESYREKIKAKLSLKNAAELTHFAIQWRLDENNES